MGRRFYFGSNMTLKECWAEAKRTGRKQILRFMLDMKRAGLKSKMRFYRGRSSWTGPAVVVHELQEALSATKIKCQWDNMGLDFVVYPVQSLD